MDPFADEFTMTTLVMNDEKSALSLEFDHLMRKLNIVQEGIGISFRANIICDQKIIDKFGKILDHFGIQDGDTKYLSRDHVLIKELYQIIIDKIRESF